MSTSAGPARLPAVVVLTDRRIAAAAGHSLPALVASLAGLDVGVLYREKDLPATERVAIGHEVADAARRAGLLLLVASDPDIAQRIGSDGVHLAAADPASSYGLVGRSCHDARELAAATAEDAAYATVSPVYATPTKPGHGPPLALDGLALLAHGTRLAIYALGGVGPGRAAECVEAGAHGVAVLGAVMGATDPAEMAAALVREVLAARAPAD